MLFANLKLFIEFPFSKITKVYLSNSNLSFQYQSYTPYVNRVRHIGILLSPRHAFLFSTVIEMRIYCIPGQPNHDHHLRLNSTFPYETQCPFTEHKFVAYKVFSQTI